MRSFEVVEGEGPSGPSTLVPSNGASAGGSGAAPSATEWTAPYSLENVIGTYGDCRSGGRQHRGIDVAGVGEDLGLGTPVYSMVDAEVTMIGRPEDDAHNFGRRDRRDGETERGKQMVPRSKEVPGYGRVFFFTRKAGKWRSGVIIVIWVISGPYTGYTVRYMHLGEIHPDVKVGDTVRAGQEIAVMGGTAIQWSTPHVHIDVEDRDGHRVDFAPMLGMERDKRR